MVPEAETRARLLRDIAVIANQSDDPAGALPAAMELVCRFTGWPLALAYLAQTGQPDRFSYGGIHWIDVERLETEAGRLIVQESFRRGDGFLGRCAESGVPAWAPPEEIPGLLPAALRSAGMKGIYLVPILSGDTVAGVLQFVTATGNRPPAPLLETIGLVGTHLGRVIERQGREREVAIMATREQEMLGREIHDGLGQLLTGLGMLARQIHQRLAGAERPEADAAARLFEGLEEAKAQLRALSRGLVPVELDEEGLMTALGDLVENTRTATGIPCRFHCPKPVRMTDPFRALQLYRIAQEALANAVRHAGADRIDIRLVRDTGRLRLEIEDDGKGMPPETGIAGLGWRNMRHRARLLQGQLSVRPSSTGGVLVTCETSL